MEDTADIIAVCEKKTEEPSTVLRGSDGDITAVYTLSALEIKSVEKGDVTKGDIITVLENEGYVEETNTIYHIAGYKKMESGKQYLLLLRAADGNPWFIPVGVNVGKIPLDKSEKIISDQCDEPTLITETKALQSQIKEEYDKSVKEK